MIKNLAAAVFLIVSPIAAETVSEQSVVNVVWIKKAERKLHLVMDWKITHTFNISLGQNPLGHKQKAGDSRTPEGLYYINSRNPRSRFFLSLGISFPDQEDRRVAKLMGYDPGDSIAIHGEPNDPTKEDRLKEDWTQGCIALKNEDMQFVWQLVEKRTPVLIEP